MSGGDAYLAAGGDGAGGLAPGVVQVLAPVVLRLVRGGQDARPDVRPRAVVERLLLAPEDVGVRVRVQMRRDLKERERQRERLRRRILAGD